MKHIIILGDGMADHPVERLGGKTLLQYADTPWMNLVAKKGRCGRVVTIPDGYAPGSEVANTAIMGYDLDQVYEGRGPLEAASIGYEMTAEDMAMRCNIVTLADGKIKNHHGGHLTTEEGGELIDSLEANLGGEDIKFVKGIQYRHLLIIRHGNKHIECAPPHDHPDEQWRPLLVRCAKGLEPGGYEKTRLYEEDKQAGRMSPAATADLLNNLILRSQELLVEHPLNVKRAAEGKLQANSIWPWSAGYRPSMKTISQMYPQVKSGAVISAVDLIRGIGHYAGLRKIIVEGATGLYNTNYEGKAQAAIEALKKDDFVFLHVEASDEAGHDGDLDLKLKTIENLDHRIVGPIYKELESWEETVAMAVLPDHPTPVEVRTHVSEPVPFAFYYRGIDADDVDSYDEVSCARGSYGLLRLQEFMREFMRLG